MVSEPHKWAKSFCESGADNITFHMEKFKTSAMDDTAENIKLWDLQHMIQLTQLIHNHGKKASVSVKPKTPIEQLFPLLDSADAHVHMVLVMTVEPGFGGQSFMSGMLDKVATLRKRYPQLNIQVDGGVTEETVIPSAKAGANVIVAGSSIFNSSNVPKTIQVMRDAVQAHLL